MLALGEADGEYQYKRFGSRNGNLLLSRGLATWTTRAESGSPLVFAVAFLYVAKTKSVGKGEEPPGQGGGSWDASTADLT